MSVSSQIALDKFQMFLIHINEKLTQHFLRLNIVQDEEHE